MRIDIVVKTHEGQVYLMEINEPKNYNGSLRLSIEGGCLFVHNVFDGEGIFDVFRLDNMEPSKFRMPINRTYFRSAPYPDDFMGVVKTETVGGFYTKLKIDLADVVSVNTGLSRWEKM